MTKIYTKTGDDGTTGLVGGNRIKKNDPRLEAYGTVDELNSWIGLIRTFHEDEFTEELLAEIQNILFNIGSRLASDEKGEFYTRNLKLTTADIEKLESAIDLFEKDLPRLNFFILPGGDSQVSQCHIARTVCRRAERRILEFAESHEVDNDIILYINRLSDFLFVLARKTGSKNGTKEIRWKQK